jgi:glucosamine--fructose-6-phosphate aminotransferase (isomerizing)
MCGIGGFSLSKDSKIRPRELSNALLTALESRGSMASGIAWHAPDMSGVHKGATPGSGLALKGVPKTVRTGIVHTRLATHGSTTDNRNNHPVMSPSQNIALVHNGVIYNHNYVRSILSSRIKFDVDTAVIPALIEEHSHDLESLRELDGDAAIAWLRDDDPGVLNLARLEHSPLVVCQVEDGSFIFASTEALLWQVLIKLDLMPDFITNVEQYTYLRVVDGVITAMNSLGKSKHMGGGYNYGYYRHQTAGAKATGNVWYDDPYSGAMVYGDEYEDDYWTYAVDKANTAKKTDFLGAELKGKPHYYIAYRKVGIMSTDPKHVQYAYYNGYKYEDYEDDLSYFERETKDYDLIDFGIVLDDGTLYSDARNVEPVVDSCALF